jgi:hypothetical protein
MTTEVEFASQLDMLHNIVLSFFQRSSRLSLSGSKAHISVAYDDYLSAHV